MKSKILFVDDELTNMNSFILELQLTLTDYEVVQKRDVDSAFKYLEENYGEIKLLILDILMPSGKITENMDTADGVETGLRFLQIIRKSFLDIPIFIFSYINDTHKKLDKIISEDENTRFLAKHDLLPFELAEQVEKILASGAK